MLRHLPHLTISVCLLPTLPVLASADEGGFLDDAKASLLLRNFYMNRNYVGEAARTRRRNGPRASFSTPAPATPRAPSGSAWTYSGCTA